MQYKNLKNIKAENQRKRQSERLKNDITRRLLNYLERKYEMRLLLSGKNKLKALYPFTHRCCSRFTYPGAWFSVLNCKHYKMCLF